MQRKLTLIVMLATFGLLMFVSPVKSDEATYQKKEVLTKQSVKLTDVPEAVQKAVKDFARGGEIKELEKVCRGPEMWYEAEVLKDGKEWDLMIGQDGSILEAKEEKEEKEEGVEEKEIKPEELPEPVKKTITELAKGSEIKELELIQKQDKVYYKAEFLLDGKEVEVKVDKEGKLLSQKTEKSEAEECKPKEETEVEIDLKQVPQKVQETLNKYVGDSPIEKVVLETKDGVKIYEAHFQKDGKKMEVYVLEDGTWIETEEIISAPEVPEVVKKAAQKKFGTTAEIKYNKKLMIAYEAEAVVKGEEKEILITPDGDVFVEKTWKKD
ncbi:MAG: PepSY-like domain-containing protein [Candidatus Sumerlaeia bacterium]|nr:PepSY-like domain-containing protein [Candidatus Sumerlaeia bacterium]